MFCDIQYNCDNPEETPLISDYFRVLLLISNYEKIFENIPLQDTSDGKHLLYPMI